MELNSERFIETVNMVGESLLEKMNSELYVDSFSMGIGIENYSGVMHLATGDIAVSVYDDEVLVDLPDKDNTFGEKRAMVQKEVDIIRKYLKDIEVLVSRVQDYADNSEESSLIVMEE